MTTCYFVSDLHGKMSRYENLVKKIVLEKPAMVFITGDLLPHGLNKGPGKLNADEFARDYLPGKFRKLKDLLGNDYPEVLLILGNDDPRLVEQYMMSNEKQGLWRYIHNKRVDIMGYTFTGYAMVPPTPFQIKDWERYDVSRFTDPGCTPPSEGYRTVAPDADIEYATIQSDLEKLSTGQDQSKAVWLFHSPPYQSKLDRAALDGITIDHVPLDVHVGSIAIQRFITEKQPWLTLHGHIHESTRLTGTWKEKFGRTSSLNAAWDGPELCLVRLQLENPEDALWELIE